MKTNFKISTSKEDLDIDMIYHFLSEQSYWAKGRSISKIKKSIDNSFCFGVYKEKEMVGFARVVTDYSVFAWIMDVFILPEYRGNGLGKMLMEAITTHQELQTLQRWGLATADAHKLYEKYGFNLIKKPEIFMEKVALPK